jgi:nucleotide-binding universal stress UspA family protein
MKQNNKNLLVCLTCECHSEYAFNWVLSYLVQEGDFLNLIIVIPPIEKESTTFTSCYVATPPCALSGSLTEAHRKRVLQACTRFMQAKEQQIRKKFPLLKVELQVVEGDAKEEILQAALRMNPDLVVMGGKSISKLRRALLGSVSDYCVHHSPFPVLIIKDRGECANVEHDGRVECPL